ncbi:MAG: hypothetical protein AAGI03_16985 [Pseudomonadota bacterium]
MDKLEKAVREASRAYHAATGHHEQLRAAPMPKDPDEAMALREAIDMADAEQSRAFGRLLDAKSDYSIRGRRWAR